MLVGVTGLELSRADFYEKELSFQVSCSYGPGRYDPAYEEGGHDYPIAHVRWTEQRNFEAILDLMAAGRLELAPLLTRRVALEDAAEAYGTLDQALGVLLEYPADRLRPVAHTVRSKAAGGGGGKPADEAPRIALIGSGGYGGRVLAPAFADAGAYLHTIVSAKGVSATRHADKHGFAFVSTDADSVYSLPDVDAVVIATRHHAHAAMVLEGLDKGNHVFVEKPLCLTEDEADAIEAAAAAADRQLMVGFNRRFAPLVRLAHEKLAAVNAPKSVIITVNAGFVPADDWQHDPATGGGRIVGEGCHFIDLARHLAGAAVTSLHALALEPEGATPPDRVQMLLGFANGSTATIQYLANGHKGFPKERVEVFCAGRILQIDNFRSLRAWGWPGLGTKRLWRQDKGNAAGVQAFCEGLRTGRPPIPLDEIIEVSRWAIRAQAQVGA